MPTTWIINYIKSNPYKTYRIKWLRINHKFGYFALERKDGKKLKNDKAGELVSLISYLYSKEGCLIVGEYSIPMKVDNADFLPSLQEYKQSLIARKIR